MSTRKQRGDSRLKTLDEKLQEEIFRRCETGKYADVAKWLRAEFSIATSEGALSEFFSWHALRQRMRRADSHVRNLDELIDEHGLKLDPQKRKDTMNALFLTLASEGGDFETFEAAYKLILAGDKLDVEKRRVTLLEAKAKQAEDAAKVTGDEELTPEEKDARLKRIFGIAA